MVVPIERHFLALLPLVVIHNMVMRTMMGQLHQLGLLSAQTGPAPTAVKPPATPVVHRPLMTLTRSAPTACDWDSC
jgi:hypothetical protein